MEGEEWEEEEEGVQGGSRALAAQGEEERRREEVMTSRAIFVTFKVPVVLCVWGGWVIGDEGEW